MAKVEDKKGCDCIGVETWICMFRGKGNLCEKPKNRIPYDYGTCPHQILGGIGMDSLKDLIDYWKKKLKESPLPYNSDRILQTIEFLKELQNFRDRETRRETYYVTSH